MLQHLVTGRNPRTAFTTFDLPAFYRHHANFPPIRTLDSTLPVALEAAIAAALRDKPDDRPTITQWKADLEKILRPQSGARPFTWQDGSRSHKPEELPALANRQWEEAKGYLYGGKWRRWFEDDLKRNDMAALVRQTITQQQKEDVGLDTFLRALDPAFPPAKLQINSAALDFGTVPWQTQQTVSLEIRNSGSGCLYGQITGLPTWLQVDLAQFATHERQPIAVTADANALSPRRQPYTATLTIDAGTSGQAQLLVHLTVPEPQLLVEPPQLNLGVSSRGANLADTFIVRNTGGSAFEGTARSDAAWLTVQPASFRGEAAKTSYLQIEADTNRMTPAQHTAKVRIQAQAGGWQQTAERQVTMRLLKSLWQRAMPDLSRGTRNWAAAGITWLAVAVGLILLLIGGGSLATGLFDSAEPQPAPTEEIVVATTNTPTATQTATPIPIDTPTPAEIAPEIPTATDTPSPNPTIQLPVAAISSDKAAQVTELARWGKGNVASGLAYSPDGKLLAMGSSIGVYLYDTETQKVVRFLDTNDWVSSIAFSPNGETMAVNSDTSVQLWRVADGQLTSTLTGHTDTVSSVTFSPDGKMLASSSDDGTIRLWGVAP